MDSDIVEYVIAGVATLVGVILAIAVITCSTSVLPHFRITTAMSILSASLLVASIVPQLVANESLKSKIDDTVVVVFPALFPPIVFLRIPLSYDYVCHAQQSKTYLAAVTHFSFELILLILFISNSNSQSSGGSHPRAYGHFELEAAPPHYGCLCGGIARPAGGWLGISHQKS
jgi:hypothetical protein